MSLRKYGENQESQDIPLIAQIAKVNLIIW